MADITLSSIIKYDLASTSAQGLMSAADKLKLDGVEPAATTDMTPAEILSAVLTVDGTTSNLDADLLDGQQGAYYLDLTNSTNALPVARLPAYTGDVTSVAGSNATTIADGVVTLLKMANIATNTLIGRSTAGGGVPEVITVGSGLTLAAGVLSAADGGSVTTSSTDILTNKTLDSFTNYIEADTVHIEVRNETGATIAKGSTVYITGYNLSELMPTVGLADASVLGTMPALGLAAANIPTASNGGVVRVGVLRNFNTNVWTVGTLLYVSETAGTLTSTKPASPALVQPIATVIRSHASQGILDVDTQGIQADLSPYAPTSSPPFTGIPTAPTAAAGTNTTQLSTTAFVQEARLPRTTVAATASTLTVNCDTTDLAILTGLSSNLTFADPTGTPLQGERLMYRIKDNGTFRTFTFESLFRSMGAALPPGSTVGKTTYMGFIYNATDVKWDLIALMTEA